MFRCALILLALTFSALSHSTRAADTAPPAKLTPQQQEKLQKLLLEYRVAGKTAAQKEQIVDQVLEIGPFGVNALQAIIEKQVRLPLEKYREKFFRQATVLAGTKLRTVPAAEVANLRETVLALGKQDNLSKEEIVMKADPAMKELSELLVISRQAVLESQADLTKDRGKLMEVAQPWERCVAYQLSQLPEDKRSKEKVTFDSYLDGEEELAARLAMPMNAQFHSVLAANDRLAAQLDPEESKTILACNLTRTLLGLNPCLIDPKLCAAARDHSSDMETLKFFDHLSPVEGKKDPWERAKRMGTTARSENIFTGILDGKRANDAWFHSPGHHKNMLSNHVRIGVGRSGAYFTEMFGG